MQHTPDREFDKLFKDRFDDAEIEPSTNLWANIEQQLAPQKKRSFPIYWMAAASVVLAITAMLVLQKKEVVKLQGKDQSTNVVKSAIDGVVNANTTIVPTKVEKKELAVASPVKKLYANKENKTIENVDNREIANVSKNNQSAVQPIIEYPRLAIKQQEVKPLDVTPIKEATVENPIVIAKVEVEKSIDDNTIDEIGTERKGIRNVGDIVNYVVDKVDKRDKKLLRFNTDDDDNSSLIGINIGFLKLNSKKHK